MEFIFQILAQLFSPVDEDQPMEQKHNMEQVEATKEIVAKAETEEQEEPNLFGMMEFH